jgi:cyclopropane-fatty-acyl-phospholipid synthase
MSTDNTSLLRERSPEIKEASVFLEALFPRPRVFAIRLWDETLLDGAAESRFTLVLNHSGSLQSMFRLPLELSLAEAYLRGDFDIEGDITELGPALLAARKQIDSPRSALRLAARAMRLRGRAAVRERRQGYGEAPARLSARPFTRKWDDEGISYHYDAGNEFYQLFLDERMVYSCGYFPGGEGNLDEAQFNKLDYICRKLRLREGEHLLDIGCGWGALVMHAAMRFGVTALGVTLSRQQHELAARRIDAAGLSDRVRVLLSDYRDVRDESFDKVASVGMFEHVGRRRLPEYFRFVFDVLRPGGVFLNHGIARGPGWKNSWLEQRRDSLILGGDIFRRRYVLPSGELLPVSDVNLIAEQTGFEVRDVENLREHYAFTLAAWVQRLETNRNRAIQLGGERMYRLWRLYMGVASNQFRRGELQLFQTLLAKPTGDFSNLPFSRRDLYDETIA